MIRVLIADDHELFRDGLRRVLEADPRLEVVAEAGTAAELLDATRAKRPDVVLLDISMPGRGGLEALKDVKNLRKETKVLVLSSHPEDRYAVRSIKAGADRYLTKSTPSAELIEAIMRVFNGRKYITPSLAEMLAVSVGEDSERAVDRLSDRELLVLRRMATGSSPTDIAEELSLSIKTVSTYRRCLLDKLGLENNAELIRFAVDQDIGW